jgi:hypothetical protein
MRLAPGQEAWPRECFHDRLNTDLMERKVYGHEIGGMPPGEEIQDAPNRG